jgi:hypothetical protein
MIETLLGGLLGGAFRLAPEILKWLDRKGERSHELAMQDKALEFEKLRGAQRMAEIGAGADAAWNVGAIETLREAVAAQGQRSRVRWADALSVSVRPVITYWFMALYSQPSWTSPLTSALDGCRRRRCGGGSISGTGAVQRKSYAAGYTAGAGSCQVWL